MECLKQEEVEQRRSLQRSFGRITEKAGKITLIVPQTGFLLLVFSQECLRQVMPDNKCDGDATTGVSRGFLVDEKLSSGKGRRNRRLSSNSRRRDALHSQDILTANSVFTLGEQTYN